MTAKSHSFNTDLAKLVGLKEAILLSHLYFWYEKNKANRRNFHDGTYWTYNSINAFHEQFDYLSVKEIRGALQRLKEQGYIIEGNYNTLKIDQTKWYSVTEKTLQLFDPNWSAQKGKRFAERANDICQKGEPLPDINTDINTDNTPISPKGDLGDSLDIEEKAPIKELAQTFAETYQRVYHHMTRREIPITAINLPLIERKIRKLGATYDHDLIFGAMIESMKDSWEQRNNYPSSTINKLFDASNILRWTAKKQQISNTY